MDLKLFFKFDFQSWAFPIDSYSLIDNYFHEIIDIPAPASYDDEHWIVHFDKCLAVSVQLQCDLVILHNYLSCCRFRQLT